MPDIDSARIPYHSDGTLGRSFNTDDRNLTIGSNWNILPGVGWHEIAPTALAAMNSVTGANAILPISVSDSNMDMQILFPVPTDLDGIYAPIFNGFVRPTAATPIVWYPRAMPVRLDYSLDSLTGDDGTWTTWGVLPPSFVGYRTDESLIPHHAVHLFAVNPGLWGSQEPYRAVMLAQNFQAPDIAAIHKRLYVSFANGGVTPLALKKIRGIRLTVQPWVAVPGYSTQNDGGFSANLFLFGAPSEGWHDFLQLEETTFAQELDHDVDLGTFPYHSSADRTLRVRNRSPLRTAENITVGIEPAGGLLTPYRGMFLFSLDRKRWDESLKLYNLGPHSVSPTIWVRRVTGVEFPEGAGQVLLSARVGRWRS